MKQFAGLFIAVLLLAGTLASQQQAPPQQQPVSTPTESLSAIVPKNDFLNKVEELRATQRIVADLEATLRVLRPRMENMANELNKEIPVGYGWNDERKLFVPAAKPENSASQPAKQP